MYKNKNISIYLSALDIILFQIVRKQTYFENFKNLNLLNYEIRGFNCSQTNRAQSSVKAIITCETKCVKSKNKSYFLLMQISHFFSFFFSSFFKLESH